MKLNEKLVRRFEREQKKYGTTVALTNIMWLIATDILHDAGVSSIKTSNWSYDGKKNKRS